MLDATAIADIIATYTKYNWVLRRVLLTEELGKKLDNEKSTLFGDVGIINSAIDAAWFSREPGDDVIAWELRYLGDIPFALLQKVDEKDPEFDKILSGVETRLGETIAAKRSA